MTETTQEDRDQIREDYHLQGLEDVQRAVNDAETLARVLDQVIVRTEDMPGWAHNWEKDGSGCFWTNSSREIPKGCSEEAKAPDLRPDSPGLIYLPIIDAPGAGKEGGN